MSDRKAPLILLACLSATTAASAEVFYSKDGVTSEGELSLAMPDFAECQASSGNTPIDLWLVTFRVRNDSGKRLAWVGSDVIVDASKPDCPRLVAAPDAPALHMTPPRWPRLHLMLELPEGLDSGGHSQRMHYLRVPSGDRPVFDNPNLGYQFAEVASAGVGPRIADLEAGTGGPARQLPPDIEADRYLLRAERAVRDGDPSAARAAMERLDELQREHGLSPAAEDHFRYAQAWEAAGEPERAMEWAVRYLQLRGREANRYTEALKLMNRAESGVPPSASGGAVQPAEPACEGRAEGTGCWMELESPTGCRVWTNNYRADDTATWTGACSGGLPSGTGTLRWVHAGELFEEAGLFQDGKKTGRWVWRFPGGGVWEGPFVDGNRHGHWIERDGAWVEEGPYKAGKRHGHWVEIFDDKDWPRVRGRPVYRRAAAWQLDTDRRR